MSRATPMAPEDRRQAIIDATLPLLLEKGPEISTRDIARIAGVAEGTIFRAFDTKDELIGSVIAEAIRPTATLAAIDALGPQSLDERAAALLGILAADLQRVRALFSHLARAGVGPHHGPPKKPDPNHDGRAAVLAATARALEPYRDQLRVPTTTAAQLLSALSFATSFSLSGEDDPDPHDLARLALYGIAEGERCSAY